MRAAAAAAGILHVVEAEPVSQAERARILATTRGLGQQVDRLIAEEREPL